MRHIAFLLIIGSLAGCECDCKSDYEICIDEMAAGLVGVQPFYRNSPHTEKSARTTAAEICAKNMNR